uniref:Uncharacterized protein n=1 Tax=Strigamia maritima TaxID=126957 RepID=T1JCH8_STRMM
MTALSCRVISVITMQIATGFSVARQDIAERQDIAGRHTGQDPGHRRAAHGPGSRTSSSGTRARIQDIVERHTGQDIDPDFGS